MSWFVAVIFAPLIGKAILTPPKRSRPTQAEPGRKGFRRASCGVAIGSRWLTLGVTLGAFGASLSCCGSCRQQFFPASNRPELTVDMTLPQSASIHATEAHVERMEALLKGDPDVDHYSTYVGRGAIRFILTLNVQLANPFFAQFVIVAKDVEARERLHAKLEKLLAEELPRRRRLRFAARTRAAGRVAAAVPGIGSGSGRGAPHLRLIWPSSWVPSRAHVTSTSTGWSRRGSCEST